MSPPDRKRLCKFNTARWARTHIDVLAHEMLLIEREKLKNFAAFATHATALSSSSACPFES